MPIPRFVLFTGLGSAVWCTILTTIGWLIGKQESILLNTLDEEARRYVSRAFVVIGPLLVLIVVVYLWRQRRRAARDGQRVGGVGSAGGGP